MTIKKIIWIILRRKPTHCVNCKNLIRAWSFNICKAKPIPYTGKGIDERSRNQRYELIKEVNYDEMCLKYKPITTMKERL